MAQLVIDRLTVGYDTKAVVEDISFSVERGDYLTVVGDNGAGKSTLLKTLLQLLKPLSGSVTLCEGLRKTDIGYLPQARDVQKDFPASVYEIVISGCLNKCGLRPFYNQAEYRLALGSMEKLGISHLSARCFRELSGGQQQRVLLARSLCASKKLLILDEPSAGLDPEAAQDMYNAVFMLNQEGTTIIAVSHDINAANRYSSHILRIEDGRSFVSENRRKHDVT